MSRDADRPRNPRRVAAGRANRQKRGPLTEEGRVRLSQAARRHRPWEHATGPKTPAGRAQAARNGRCRCQEPLSARQSRALLSGIHTLIRAIQRTCHQAARQDTDGANVGDTASR